MAGSPDAQKRQRRSDRTGASKVFRGGAPRRRHERSGVLPISLFLYGIPSPQHAAQFVLALTPLIAIVVLKQTGNLRLAECVSIFGWAALAANVGASTQGYEAVSLTLLTIALLRPR